MRCSRWCSAPIISMIWRRRATKSANNRVASSGSGRTCGFVASAKCAMTAASIVGFRTLPQRLGEGPDLGRIDDDDRQLGFRESCRHDGLETPGRLQGHDVGRALGCCALYAGA